MRVLAFLLLAGAAAPVAEAGAKANTCELQKDCFRVTMELVDSSECGAYSGGRKLNDGIQSDGTWASAGNSSSRELAAGKASPCDWKVCMVWDFDMPGCVKDSGDKLANQCSKSADHCSEAKDFSGATLTKQAPNGHTDCVIVGQYDAAGFLMRDQKCTNDARLASYDVEGSYESFCGAATGLGIGSCAPETNGAYKECYWQFRSPACPATEEPSDDLNPGPPMDPNAPSTSPTALPSAGPTDAPTDAPSAGPTESPTAAPTDGPTVGPTESPTAGPSEGPSAGPTDAPVAGTTDGPSELPTDGPTDGPSESPTDGPSEGPTGEPNDGPTKSPTDTTVAPTDIYEWMRNAPAMLVLCECVDYFNIPADGTYKISNFQYPGNVEVQIRQRLYHHKAYYNEAAVVGLGSEMFEVTADGYYVDGTEVTLPTTVNGYSITVPTYSDGRQVAEIDFGPYSLQFTQFNGGENLHLRVTAI